MISFRQGGGNIGAEHFVRIMEDVFEPGQFKIGNLVCYVYPKGLLQTPILTACEMMRLNIPRPGYNSHDIVKVAIDDLVEWLHCPFPAGNGSQTRQATFDPTLDPFKLDETLEEKFYQRSEHFRGLPSPFGNKFLNEILREILEKV